METASTGNSYRGRVGSSPRVAYASDPTFALMNALIGMLSG
jgi:hypothetical protein